MMISRPAARAVAARTRAAALLFTTPAACAPGTARLSASSDAPAALTGPRPGAEVELDVAGARGGAMASFAAWLSGARPRLVWTRTPVALTTSVSEAAVAGSSAAADVRDLVGGDLGVPRPFLRAADRGLDQVPADAALGRPHARVAEQLVGARDLP